MTPKQVFLGTKPDISHIRIFGTWAFVHVPNEKRHKFASKTTRCILLGPDESTKGYRCYCLQTQRIIISLDVKIDEDNPGDISYSHLPANNHVCDQFKVIISIPYDVQASTHDIQNLPLQQDNPPSTISGHLKETSPPLLCFPMSPDITQSR